MYCWFDTFECKEISRQQWLSALRQPLLDFYPCPRCLDDGRSVPFSRETAARKWRQVIFKEKERLVFHSPVTSKSLNSSTMHVWCRIEVKAITRSSAIYQLMICLMRLRLVSYLSRYSMWEILGHPVSVSRRAPVVRQVQVFFHS